MPKIDEKAWVPLGFAITFIGGAGYWMAVLDSKEQAQAAMISETRAKTERVEDYMQSIDHRLSLIEGELKEVRSLQRRK